MSKILKFDTTTSPITAYEWEHGSWVAEEAEHNESLILNDDGTVTLTETCRDKIKTVVYAVAGKAADGSDYYAPVSSSSEASNLVFAMEMATTAAGASVQDDDQDGDGHHDDHIRGGKGKDKKHGWAGNDSFDGAEGDDDLYGDDGDDDLLGGSGDDMLHGGEGLDHLEGNDGKDKLYGDVGDDNLNGGLGKDLLEGGAGNDILAGGTDADSVRGGDGNDELCDDAGNDQLEGGTGDDTFLAGMGAGNDVLNGGAGMDTVDYSEATKAVIIDLQKGQGACMGLGRDRLNAIENANGSDFDDSIAGSKFANLLDGGDGDDLIFGGLGADMLTGGMGSDVFVYRGIKDSGTATTGRDVITDFLTGDRIDFSAMDAKAGFTRNDSFEFLDAAPTADGNGKIWFDAEHQTLYGSTDKDLDPEFSVVLLGVSDISSADLVL